MLNKNKKADASSLLVVIPSVLILVVVGVVISMGALTQAKVGSQMTSDSLEYNATVKSKEGIKFLSDFQPTFGTILAVVIVITVLLGSFAFLFYQNQFQQ